MLFATPEPEIEIDCRTAPLSSTVTMMEADLLPAVAVMTALPALMPRTVPLATDATEAFDVLHVTVRSVALFGSTVALRFRPAPTLIVALPPDTPVPEIATDCTAT